MSCLYLPDNGICPYCGEEIDISYLGFIINSDRKIYYKLFCYNCQSEFIVEKIQENQNDILA